MPEIQPCDRCNRRVDRRYLWTIGIGINPDLSWELCRFCHDDMLLEMRYGEGAK